MDLKTKNHEKILCDTILYDRKEWKWNEIYDRYL